MLKLSEFKFDDGDHATFLGYEIGPDWNGFKHVGVPMSHGGALLTALNLWNTSDQRPAYIVPETGDIVDPQSGNVLSVTWHRFEGQEPIRVYDLNGFGVISAEGDEPDPGDRCTNLCTLEDGHAGECIQ